MKENEKQFPNKVYEIKHVLGDGEYIVVHGLIKLSEDMQVAVVHILRFEKGKIIEMWDIGQQIPKDIVNEDGMF